MPVTDRDPAQTWKADGLAAVQKQCGIFLGKWDIFATISHTSGFDLKSGFLGAVGAVAANMRRSPK